MPPAGIGVSPINPLGIDPPDVLQRPQSVRTSIGRINTQPQTEANTLVRAPEPSSNGQETENNLDTNAPLENATTAFTLRSEPPRLQLDIAQGLGAQIDLVAY